MDEPGISVDFSFDAGGLDVEALTRATADMWADLPFDREALASLKRDGMALDGVNLGGASPYQFAPDGAEMRVSASGDHAEILLDLWRIHFWRGVRPRHLAA